MTHSLISDLKNTFPETKGVPDRWKLGLSDEEMTDIAKHHLGLTNFKGVIPKDHLPVFTQYVIEAAPYEQSTVLINTARDREPGKHWGWRSITNPPLITGLVKMDVWWSTLTLMEWLTYCLKSTNSLRKCPPLTPLAIIL